MGFEQLQANSVLSIVAPTASGKTALACKLYDTDRFELVSVDSALIYKDMNIGTAKPTADELKRYPHAIVDIISPEQQYNVIDFCDEVKKQIDIAHSNQKIPLLIGGTMMYYMAMFEGISSLPSTDPLIREKVTQWLASDGIDELYKYLQSNDPVTAQRLNVHDTQRITRAVEVHMQTAEPISKLQALPKMALSHNTEQQWLAYTVVPDRAWLHERIALRLDIMWADGFVNEVVGLIENYTLHQDLPSMRCIGYRQVIDCLIAEKLVYSDVKKGLLSLTDEALLLREHGVCIEESLLKSSCQDMKNKALYATRQLAKRQNTWIRKMNNLSDRSSISTHHCESISQVDSHLTSLV